MRPSLSTTLFNSEPLQRRHLELCAEYGFTRLEISGPKNMFDWRKPENVRKLRGWLEELGIEAVSYHLPFYDGRWTDSFHWLSLSDPYGPWLVQALDHKIRAAYVAAELGCKFVVEHGPGDEEEVVNGDGKTEAPAVLYETNTLERVLSTYRRAFEIFYRAIESTGLTVALENVNTAGSDPKRLAGFCREISSQRLGICLDVGHANLEGNPVEALSAAKGHLHAVHIHDNLGLDDQHLDPFQGNIQWEPTLAKISEIGLPGGFTVEANYLGHKGAQGEFEKRLAELAGVCKDLAAKQPDILEF